MSNPSEVSPADRRNALDVLRGSRILAYTVGALSLIAGIVLLFWPDRTVTVIARLIGILFIVVGFGQAAEAFTHRSDTYWGLLLVRGLINLGVGIALLAWPGVTLNVVIWLVGLNLVITGAIGMFAGFNVPSERGKSAILVQSALTIVLGLLIMVWPSATLTVIGIVVAAVLIIIGITLFWSGYQLSAVSRELEK